MKRIIITVSTALLVAGPVTMGLIGNTSFAKSVPVRVPAQATVTVVESHHSQRPSETPTSEPDEHMGVPRLTFEPRDDKGGLRSTSTTERSGVRHVTHNDSFATKEDNGGHGKNGGEAAGGKDARAGHQ